MQVAFVALLDPLSYNQVRKLQVEIHKDFGAKEPLKLEPHFTVKYKFDTDNLAAVEEYFDGLVAEEKSFEAIIGGVGAFEKKVVFLDIAKNTDITKLHLKILDDVKERFLVQPGEFEGESLHFHITLAYKDIDDVMFNRIQEMLKKHTLKFNFPIRQLGLYLSLSPNEDWFLYKIGNLK